MIFVSGLGVTPCKLKFFSLSNKDGHTKCDSSLSPYSTHSTELSVLDGCILWGSRVVVPPQGQQAVLQELHSAHPGMMRMKALARMYVWWPGLENDIEETIRLCDECQLNQSNPPLAPLSP